MTTPSPHVPRDSTSPPIQLDALCGICGFRYGLHRGTPDDGRCPTNLGWAKTHFTRKDEQCGATGQTEGGWRGFCFLPLGHDGEHMDVGL